MVFSPDPRASITLTKSPKGIPMKQDSIHLSEMQVALLLFFANRRDLPSARKHRNDNQRLDRSRATGLRHRLGSLSDDRTRSTRRRRPRTRNSPRTSPRLTRSGPLKQDVGFTRYLRPHEATVGRMGALMPGNTAERRALTR